MRAAIFLNGSPDSEPLIRAVASRADLVVAADGGARHALAAGIVPDQVVGDMDSLGEDLALEVERRGASLERHPERKDKMDGHLAVLAAGERGVTAADFLCAAGGKPGAVFAVPHILLVAERIGLRSTVVTDWGRMFVIEGRSRVVEGSARDSVSIFPFSGQATGVTLKGMVYPLENADLEPGDTLGFHNELIGREAKVSVESGTLLVVHEARDRLHGPPHENGLR
ncbi:MAG: thiamine diphosphokinase [Rubrobacter sp.]|nr:thiamine diphosphokinase [Rubrobacter sp.]